ncbi:MAG: hypothetical protein N4A62_19315 [Marinisporobacter sp.]|nr:hypothetical protein [Marinisporobacter sp.]
MKIRLHFPKTLEKQKRFNEKIEQEHINLMKGYIEKLSISQEEKYKLWEIIKLEIKKNAENNYPMN